MQELMRVQPGRRIHPIPAPAEINGTGSPPLV
jgi:hypothetical protein